MKLANVTINYPIHGGVNNSVGHWASALRRQGAEVDILSLVITPTEKIESEEGLVLFHDSGGNPLKASEEFVEHVSKSDYDLVFVNGMFNPKTAATALALGKLSIPYVMVPHDPYHPDVLNHGRLKKWLYSKLIEIKLHNGARAIQVLSDSHIKHVKKFSQPEKVIVVSNCVDLEKISIDFGDRKLRSDEGISFYYLGRLDMNHKGLDILLRAFAMVKDRLPGGSTLTLQGPESDESDSLEALIDDLNLEDSVKILGPDFSKTSYQLIAGHDVAVLCSRFDGFSYFIMEAMLAGVPSVVSVEAGISGHVQKSGAGFVSRPDAEEFSAKLLEMSELESEQDRAMGVLGSAYVRENMNLHAIGRGALEKYQQLING